MPRLSILVPKLGAVKPFEDTLASVLQNRPGGCQILVAHAGAYDDPWRLGDEVEFVEQSDDASLVDLLNAGLNEVRAEVLHIVLGGTEASDGWTNSIHDIVTKAHRNRDSPDIGKQETGRDSHPPFLERDEVGDARDVRAGCLAEFFQFSGAVHAVA